MSHILVIEDNPDDLELITYLLNARGHATTTACDGEKGLEAARHQPPELIVCDIRLPGICGREVARQLKRHPLLKHIPLVAVTVLSGFGERDKTLAAGFDGYIPKPITPEKFAREIENFIPASGMAAHGAAAAPKGGANRH